MLKKSLNVSKMYSKTSNKGAIRIFNIDWEPFNGMAHRPWLMFFGHIICIFIWLAGLILLCISSYSPSPEANTTLLETQFSSCSVDGRELHLHTTDGETYKINVYQFYNGIFDDPAFLCNGDTYRIWITGHGYIDAMESTEGQPYITFESEREAYRRSNMGADVLLFIILLLNITFFVLALVVSRNPEWYPPWLVKILFANASEFWT